MDCTQTLTHAGGIFYRKGASGYEFLIVRSKDGQHWVLPKGHIEQGERPEDTALREVREETGVEGTIARPVGVWRFEHDGGAVHVAYFLLSFSSAAAAAQENRKTRWCSATEALNLLSFLEGKEAVQRAVELVGAEMPQ